MGRFAQNWSKEELLNLVSIWHEEAKSKELDGTSKLIKNRNIYDNYIKQNNNSEKRNQTGIVKKLERLKKWFIFVNRYNKLKNPNNRPELDWFNLNKKERKAIFKDSKCEFYNYPKSIYDAMAEFCNPDESQCIFQSEGQNSSLQDDKIDKQTNIFQSDEATESLTEMLKYFKTKYQTNALEDNAILETPTKKRKALSEIAKKENILGYEDVFKDLIETHKKEMNIITNMIIKKHDESIQKEITKHNESIRNEIAKHNELIKEDVTKYSEILTANLFKTIKEKFIYKNHKNINKTTNGEDQIESEVIQNLSPANNSKNSA